MADEELTQRVAGAAQSPAELEKTEVVPRTSPPSAQAAPVDPAAEEKTLRVDSQRPPTPQAAAGPPPASGAGQPHRAPAPPPRQPHAAGAPIPPPHGYGPNTSQNPMDAANALL